MISNEAGFPNSEYTFSLEAEKSDWKLFELHLESLQYKNIQFNQGPTKTLPYLKWKTKMKQNTKTILQ
jgi:hypothetical protein